MSQTEETHEVVHFKVSGEFVTDHGRRRMLETKSWQTGLDWLMIAMRPMNYDVAVAILCGHKKLEGINHMALVPEDRKDIREKLAKDMHYMFGGCVMHRDTWYQPYAIVTCFGPADLQDAISGINKNVGSWKPTRMYGSRETPGYQTAPRAVHYMDDKYADHATVLKYDKIKGREKVAVLWKRVNPPPPWITSFSNERWQEAFDDYIKHKNWLDVRGYDRDYGKPGEAVDIGITSKSRIDAAIATGAAREDRQALYPPRFDEEADTKARQERAVANLKPDTDYSCECGWVLRDGRFFGCGYSGHTELAYELLDLLGAERSFSTAADQAEERGWIKIAFCYMPDVDARGKRKKGGEPRKERLILFEQKLGAGKQIMRITPEQELTVQEWCKKWNEELPYWWDDCKPE